MSYKTGVDKFQTMLPDCLDNYVSEDHLCRVIDAFVEQLDMAELNFKYARHADTGCRPYNPKMMLKLYIYGFMNRVRSSRRLEAETQRNIEVMWLMDKLTPDDKTICNFRRDNAKSIKAVFRLFSKLCNDWGLYGKEVVAVDGTKIRANNSRKNNHNLTTVKRNLAWLEKRITEYMTALEENDKAEKNEIKPSTEGIKEMLEKLNTKKDKYDSLLSQIEANNGAEVSTVDEDARLMKQSGSAGLDVCYNVQSVVDSKNGLIVDIDVTNSSDDRGELFSMTEKAKEIMEADEITALADRGYYESADIVKCEGNGTKCLVSKPGTANRTNAEKYFRDKFIYNHQTDTYICPEDIVLKYMRDQELKGIKYRVYANYGACRVCPNKDKCTKAKNGRQILRSQYQDTMDIVDNRTKENKKLYKTRQQIVEAPFGTIKRIWGYSNFLCKGTEKITGEACLAFLAYNLRRVINIMGTNKLIAALK